MQFGLLSIFQNYRDQEDDTQVMRNELELAQLSDALGYDSS